MGGRASGGTGTTCVRNRALPQRDCLRNLIGLEANLWDRLPDARRSRLSKIQFGYRVQDVSDA